MNLFIKTSLSAVAVFAFSSASFAQNTQVPATTPQASQPTSPDTEHSRVDPNQVVCKYMDVTGSRLGGAKVCKTRQAWAEIAASNRDALESVQLQKYSQAPPH